MLVVHSKKIILSVALLCMCYGLFAQINLPTHDDQIVYFGIALGINSSDFRLKHHESFIQDDSIYSVEPKLGPGFNLGIVSNLKLNKRLSVRFLPSLVFAEKRLDYLLFDGTADFKTVENIYTSFPFLVKYQTDRWTNFRLYTVAGIQIDYDLASNARNRKRVDVIKARKTDISMSLGGGCQIFFGNFVMAPELRITHGLNNILFREEGYQFSRVIDTLKTRSYVFTIHLEGGGKMFRRGRR